jgi:hypothetical protein
MFFSVFFAKEVETPAAPASPPALADPPSAAPPSMVAFPDMWLLVSKVRWSKLVIWDYPFKGRVGVGEGGVTFKSPKKGAGDPPVGHRERPLR